MRLAGQPVAESEHELAAQFQCAWIPCAGDLAELAVAVSGVESVGFEVVERVERFEAKLEARLLDDIERFIQ